MGDIVPFRPRPGRIRSSLSATERRCSACGQVKPVDEFRWKVKERGERVSRCRPCEKVQRKAKYAEDKEAQRKLGASFRERRRRLVASGDIVEAPFKKCCECRREQPAAAFAWASKRDARRKVRCRKCDAACRMRLWRVGGGKEHTARREAASVRNKEIVRVAKDVPCADCGRRYPAHVMDFDHLDPTQKVAKISNMRAVLDENKLRTEIAKCDVVCSNCHRERTYRRKHGNGASDATGETGAGGQDRYDASGAR